MIKKIQIHNMIKNIIQTITTYSLLNFLIFSSYYNNDPIIEIFKPCIGALHSFLSYFLSGSSLFNYFLFDLALALFFLSFYFDELRSEFREIKKMKKFKIFCAIYFALNVFIITIKLIDGGGSIKPKNQIIIDELLKKNKILMSIDIICCIPIIEEIIFRKYLFLNIIGQKKIDFRNNFFISIFIIILIICNSALFSFLHTLGDSNLKSEKIYFILNLQFLLPSYFTGLVLSSIITHMINNFVTSIYTILTV
ncbi:hypothetical protein DMUE_2111 [Dictyocoela muelleri]|nr:hypothetical protein DMUE_2111 [Dictyocoela muelleri]